MLREQLETANESNEALTNDLQKVTDDWNDVKEKLKTTEEQWKEEQEVRRLQKNLVVMKTDLLQNFSTYFGDEHSRLLALWRAVVQIRRGFTDLKSSTQRNLDEAINDVQVLL